MSDVDTIGGAPADTGTPADNGAPADGGRFEGGGEPQGNWFDSFEDKDLSGWVGNQGFKNAETLANSYRNLQKLTGAGVDKIVKLPQEGTAEEWGEVYSKLGRPENASDYDFKLFDAEPDPKFQEMVSNAFHEAGLNHTQSAKVLNVMKEYADHLNTSYEANQAQKAEQADKALQKEWGATYKKNINTARMVAQGLELSDEQVDSLQASLGFDGLMKMLNNVANKFKINEDTFITGDNTGNNFGNMTPAAAKSRIAELKKDKVFYQRLMVDKDVDAVNEWNKLHRMAHGQA